MRYGASEVDVLRKEAEAIKDEACEEYVESRFEKIKDNDPWWLNVLYGICVGSLLLGMLSLPLTINGIWNMSIMVSQGLLSTFVVTLFISFVASITWAVCKKDDLREEFERL